MSLSEAIKKEPIAAISLLVSLGVAGLGSPLFLDWYFGPEVVVEADYKNTKDARCAPFRLVVRNDGNRPAENIVIQYDQDHFTSRGDIDGVYAHEPFVGVKKRVAYTTQPGEVRIPRLQPGQSQELRYVETIKDANTNAIRLRRIDEKDGRIIYFPRITLASHDRGSARLQKINADCGVASRNNASDRDPSRG